MVRRTRISSKTCEIPSSRKLTRGKLFYFKSLISSYVQYIFYLLGFEIRDHEKVMDAYLLQKLLKKANYALKNRTVLFKQFIKIMKLFQGLLSVHKNPRVPFIMFTIARTRL